MATAYLLLGLTEAGFTAHPIAGYNEAVAAEAVGASADTRIAALLIVGRKSAQPSAELSDTQRASELARPARRPLEELAFLDRCPQVPGGPA